MAFIESPAVIDILDSRGQTMIFPAGDVKR
jgi:hypothetical protein